MEQELARKHYEIKTSDKSGFHVVVYRIKDYDPNFNIAVTSNHEGKYGLHYSGTIHVKDLKELNKLSELICKVLTEEGIREKTRNPIKISNRFADIEVV